MSGTTEHAAIAVTAPGSTSFSRSAARRKMPSSSDDARPDDVRLNWQTSRSPSNTPQ
jgi:hypothetical protein